MRDMRLQFIYSPIYYEKLAEDAIDTISEFGDFDWFVTDAPYDGTMPFR